MSKLDELDIEMNKEFFGGIPIEDMGSNQVEEEDLRKFARKYYEAGFEAGRMDLLKGDAVINGGTLKAMREAIRQEEREAFKNMLSNKRIKQTGKPTLKNPRLITYEEVETHNALVDEILLELNKN